MGLVHITHLHSFADDDVPLVRFFLTYDHAEQSGFTYTVRANNTYDGIFWHFKGNVINQQPVSKTL